MLELLVNTILTTISVAVPMILMYLMFKKTQKYDSLIDEAKSILTVKKDEKGLLIHPKLDNLIKATSSGLLESFQMSALGQASGLARLGKGLEGAIAQDIVENQFPLLGLVDQMFGLNAMKYIKKNPRAIPQILGMVAPMLQQQGPNAQRAESKYGWNPNK